MWRTEIRREDTIAERMDEKRAKQGTWFQALALRYQSLASSLGARSSKLEDRAYTAHAQAKAPEPSPSLRIIFRASACS